MGRASSLARLPWEGAPGGPEGEQGSRPQGRGSPESPNQVLGDFSCSFFVINVHVQTQGMSEMELYCFTVALCFVPGLLLEKTHSAPPQFSQGADGWLLELDSAPVPRGKSRASSTV